MILFTLAHHQNHRERTAAALGIGMKTLYNRLRDYAVPDAPTTTPAEAGPSDEAGTTIASQNPNHSIQPPKDSP